MKQFLFQTLRQGTLSRAWLLWLMIFWGALALTPAAAAPASFFSGISDCEADAGLLAPEETSCITDTLQLEATAAINPVIPNGFAQAYLLSKGSDLNILAVGDEPQFTIDEAGDYRIHSLVYPLSLDLDIIEPGNLSILELLTVFEQGGGLICGSLDVLGAGFHIAECPCDAEAGSLNAAGVCLEGNLAEINASSAGNASIPAGFELIYVLTSGSELTIESANESPEFIVSTDKDYRIHPLVYDPNTLDLSIIDFGQTTAAEVNNLLIQGGGNICASLNLEGTQFSFGGCDACLADAGTLLPDSDNCLDGTAELTAVEDETPNVPAGYELAYVLTSGPDLVIEGLSDSLQFTVSDTGLYTIHTLVYDPQTLDLGIVEPGVTTGFDVNNLLIQGGGDICASLLVEGAQFQVDACPCLADAGTLLPDSDECLDSTAQLVAVEGEAPNVPGGYELAYVLTSGPDLVIKGLSDSLQFTVSDTGLYTIHTLVYDPQTLDLGIVEPGVTTGFDVNNLLIQGGGDICASLLVAGAQFQVDACPCLADAGTLLPDSDNCLDGTAELTAVEDEAPNVPAGYELAYVLTSGPDLVIEGLSDSLQFTVSDTGLFTIHTLVYNPQTLDLGIVEPGVTTGFDVNNLLIQGGGDICASLLVEGAQFQVDACCLADAGTLLPDSDNCLDGNAELTAVEDEAPNVPAGYELAYVLTSGTDLVIEGLSDSLQFTVSDTGLYTIHTLVYDPQTLDLGIVEPGVTTGFDVNNLLIQGGGDICASLLVAGAQFQVDACPCLADAGTLLPDSDNCLDGTAELTAVEDEAPNVPAGYELAYVLTSGPDLVIEGLSDSLQFTVSDTGLYTIHTLVYNPQTLDLSIVEPGVTTGFDVNNLLIQGGGDICASLLVVGAQFQVDACPCTADAGSLKADSDNCLDGTAELVASANVDPVVPNGYEQIFVLTSGTDLVMEAVNEDPVFTVDEEGLFTIHTLVYNPLTLDLSIINFGTTTAFDVNSLLIQGGGQICAALDIAGISFNVLECTGFRAPFPNPVQDQLFVPIPELLIGNSLSLQLRDSSGKLIREVKIEKANKLEVVDVRKIPAGGYTLSLYQADGVRRIVRRIVKM